MGAKIEMVSVACSRLSFFGGNSIRLSARAARQCIDDAGINPCDLGLIINTGIYRHKNIGEPAVAALIQEKINTRRSIKNNSDNHTRTFSFDLNNGGCGLLAGLEIVQGLINSGEISYGMVVTGDSEPFPGLSRGFNFTSAAAAIIVSGSDDSRGFSMFRTYNYPEFDEEFTGSTFYKKTGNNGKGKNILNIMQKDSYPDHCVDCAVKSLFDFLHESGKTLAEIDLIIPSQSPPGFANKMKKRIGITDNFIDLSDSGNKVFHTAGPVFALKKVCDDKRFRRSANIIFLTVGSGISVSITLYKN